MEKLRLLIWKLFLSPDKRAEKERHWIARQFERLVKGATGGGYVPPTFWEKVKIGLLLVLLIGISVLLMAAIIFAATQKMPTR